MRYQFPVQQFFMNSKLSYLHMLISISLLSRILSFKDYTKYFINCSTIISILTTITNKTIINMPTTKCNVSSLHNFFFEKSHRIIFLFNKHLTEVFTTFQRKSNLNTLFKITFSSFFSLQIKEKSFASISKPVQRLSCSNI